MGGFKNKTLNNEFISGVVNHTITHLIKCSEQMISDCLENNNPLWNDEDRITNRLVEKYLNNGSSNYRYIIQSPENFDDKTDQYIGRTDIIVISKNYFIDSKAYFIIECKRIDGREYLNKKYITEGIMRFVSTTPKYSAYYKQNILFGYIVKAISITKNTSKINTLQNTLLNEISSTGFVLEQSDDSLFYVYACNYELKSIGSVTLKHLFINFSNVIKTNTDVSHAS